MMSPTAGAAARRAGRVALRATKLTGRGIVAVTGLAALAAGPLAVGALAVSGALEDAAVEASAQADTIRPARPDGVRDDTPVRPPVPPTTEMRVSLPPSIVVDTVARRVPIAVSFGVRNVDPDLELAVEITWDQHPEGFATGRVRPRGDDTITFAGLLHHPWQVTTNVSPICEEPVGTVIVTVTEVDNPASTATAATEAVGADCEPAEAT